MAPAYITHPIKLKTCNVAFPQLQNTTTGHSSNKWFLHSIYFASIETISFGWPKPWQRNKQEVSFHFSYTPSQLSHLKNFYFYLVQKCKRNLYSNFSITSMSDVINIFKSSTLDKSRTAGTSENCKSEAVNHLLSILPNVDESELKFTINDEYFLRKTNKCCDSENGAIPAISDTLGSTMRKSLRKMIREVDIHELIHCLNEPLPDEKGSRRQSEALALKKRKSSTPVADTSTISRRGTKVRGSLEYSIKRKQSTGQTMAKIPTERRKLGRQLSLFHLILAIKTELFLTSRIFRYN